MIIAFHCNVKGTVLYESAVSNAFPSKSGVKQGCLSRPPCSESSSPSYCLAPSGTLKMAPTSKSGKRFNLVRLKSKSKIHEVLIRELLFVDDAALKSHSVDIMSTMLHPSTPTSTPQKLLHACTHARTHTLTYARTNVRTHAHKVSRGSGSGSGRGSCGSSSICNNSSRSNSSSSGSCSKSSRNSNNSSNSSVSGSCYG